MAWSLVVSVAVDIDSISPDADGQQLMDKVLEALKQDGRLRDARSVTFEVLRTTHAFSADVDVEVESLQRAEAVAGEALTDALRAVGVRPVSEVYLRQARLPWGRD